MWYTYLIPPVVGAIIGFFTNELALMMLFRPHKPKYLFGHKIPFTPGIIPKEKSRIATAIGETVSNHLVNKDTLSKTLLSDEMIAKIETGIDDYVAELKEKKENLRDYITQYLPSDDLDTVVRKVTEEFSGRIGGKIEENNLSQGISHKVVEYAMQQTGKGFLGLLQADKLVSKLSEPIEKALSKHLDNILKENAGEIVSKLVDHEITAYLDTPVCEFIQNKDNIVEKVKGIAINSYKTIITEQLPTMMDSIDIKKIVEDRINGMGMSDTEKITYSVLNKELKAIVWLGALLGGIIGLANIIIL